MTRWRDELGRKEFWLSYFSFALCESEVLSSQARLSRYGEEIDELEKRLTGRELVVRFQMRFSLRFTFLGDGFHKLTLSTPRPGRGWTWA